MEEEDSLICLKSNSAVSSDRQKKAAERSQIPAGVPHSHLSIMSSLNDSFSEALWYFASPHENCSLKNLITPSISQLCALPAIQAIGYFLILLYLFLGIAIVSDVFMCSIETITSQTRKTKVYSVLGFETEVREEKIWNDAVANLTLMALGSSAPEILLSIIEIVGSGFHAGELGPGTIVGSAAFNLMIITAVCVTGLKDGESKRIQEIQVFAVTSFFSVWAYIWLFLILVVISPDVVELWEAVVTFAFFPLLAFVAYCADKNFFRGGNLHEISSDSSASSSSRNQLPTMESTTGSSKGAGAAVPVGFNFFPKGVITKKSLVKFIAEVRRIDASITDEDAACLAANNLFEYQRRSQMFYRVSACRELSGTRAPVPRLTDNLQRVYDLLRKRCTEATARGSSSISHLNGHINRGFNDLMRPPPTVPAELVGRKSAIAVVQFTTSCISICENEGQVVIVIERVGRLDNEFDCLIETIDDTAVKNLDYVPIRQRVRFRQNEVENRVGIAVIDNHVKNEDKVFLVKLCIPEDTAERHDVAKGRICMMTVTIIDDDEPGIITFQERLQTVHVFAAEAVIPVIRENGSDGRVRVFFKINDGTARNGKDFLFNSPEGELFFPHTCTLQQIVIPIHYDFSDGVAESDHDKHFEIELVGAENGATLGKHKKQIVFLTNESDVDVTQLMSRVLATQDQLELHSSDWRDQIIDSLSPSGDGISNYVLHVLSFQWKVLFALIPPRHKYSGWLTFVTSLILIGLITTLVGDIATTFGCLVGLETSLNAITFVAVGTSLPDLFASRTAVRIDSTADNAIGNVTGSNSVNVFLGLGLPWLMAAIHWTIQGKVFHVPSGGLGFAVALYTGLAIIGITILLIRRFCAGGEVGGSKRTALLTALLLVSLWLLYVLLSALQAYGVILV